MATEIIDSPLRCPFDGNRMLYEIGQDDLSGAGDMRAVHFCLSCDYREIDKAWSKPLNTDGGAIERLRKRRLEGWQLRIVYDETPFPAEDWGDDVA